MTESEYNECVNLYADNVYRFIVKNLRHEADAQDVVQSSYEKLWINRDHVEYTRSKAYLFTIAYNQMIDHLRKVKRVTLKEDIAHNSLVTNAEPNQLKKVLNEALTKLNDTQRSLVMLKDYEGYSYAEIAEIMDLNESQVKVYLHRARLILRDYIVKMENVN
jgi:RNA polymerase sigma-70 factor (ECF subfamily)